MKSILCFGDSNTHGHVPGSKPFARYAPHERWPGVLRRELGSDWHITEEGLSGRTTVRDDPIEGPFKNGRRYLTPCLQSHAALDVVILMLGTNDLKSRFKQEAAEVAMGMGCLVHDIKELKPGPNVSEPEIIIVAPPPLLDDLKDWQKIFLNAHEKSRQLALEFEILADSLEVHFFDAASVCACDPKDGFHINGVGHEAIGVALAEKILSMGWPDD